MGFAGALDVFWLALMGKETGRPPVRAPRLHSSVLALPATDHQVDREAAPADDAGPRALGDHAARSPGTSAPDAADRAVRAADPDAGPAERQADHPRYVAAQRCRRWRRRWRWRGRRRRRRRRWRRRRRRGRARWGRRGRRRRLWRWRRWWRGGGGWGRRRRRRRRWRWRWRRWW